MNLISLTSACRLGFPNRQCWAILFSSYRLSQGCYDYLRFVSRSGKAVIPESYPSQSRPMSDGYCCQVLGGHQEFAEKSPHPHESAQESLAAWVFLPSSRPVWPCQEPHRLPRLHLWTLNRGFPNLMWDMWVADKYLKYMLNIVKCNVHKVGSSLSGCEDFSIPGGITNGVSV